MKKKAVLLTVILLIVFSGIILSINFAFAEEQGVQKNKNQLVEIPRYQIDGYKDFLSWKNDLEKTHDTYRGQAKYYVEKYQDVISEKQKEILQEYEKKILNSYNVLNLKQLRNYFDLTATKVQYRKIAEKNIEKYQNYITKKQKRQLNKYDEDIQNAESITDIEQIKEKFDNIVNKLKEKKKKANTISSSYRSFMRAGVVYAYGYKFTYYSQSVLPGGGLTIPGRHIEGGFVKDKDGYICAAGSLGRGTTGNSPWGRWKLYDTGTYGQHIDIYVQ